MKVTNISQQEKRKDRYSIFVDEKYSFSLSDIALLDAGLAVGQELSAADVEKYKELSADDKLYSSVLHYLAIRPRSVGEIKLYLMQKKVKDEAANQVIQKLLDKGLLDDEKFAKSWVDNRRLLKPISRRKLTAELRQKRVSTDIIDSTLADEEINDTDALRAMIAKKREQPKYADTEKLMAYLARQGFSYGDIKQALSEYNED